MTEGNALQRITGGSKRRFVNQTLKFVFLAGLALGLTIATFTTQLVLWTPITVGLLSLALGITGLLVCGYAWYSGQVLKTIAAQIEVSDDE